MKIDLPQMAARFERGCCCDGRKRERVGSKKGRSHCSVGEDEAWRELRTPLNRNQG